MVPAAKYPPQRPFTGPALRVCSNLAVVFQKKPEILEFSFVCIFGLRMLCPFAATPAW